MLFTAIRPIFISKFGMQCTVSLKSTYNTEICQEYSNLNFVCFALWAWEAMYDYNLVYTSPTEGWYVHNSTVYQPFFNPNMQAQTSCHLNMTFAELSCEIVEDTSYYHPAILHECFIDPTSTQVLDPQLA